MNKTSTLLFGDTLTKVSLGTFILLSACAHQAIYPNNLFESLCGNTYAGAVVSTDPQDEDWRKEKLVLGPVKCLTSTHIEMPLAVGANTSRTWVITGNTASLELRHRHLHADGSPDKVSQYGGYIDSVPRLVGEKWQMNFPADNKSIELFKANDLEVSVTNIWTLELHPGNSLAYELNRKNRHFRAEFDLTRAMQ